MTSFNQSGCFILSKISLWHRLLIVAIYVGQALQTVWPDLAIYYTLGNFSKPGQQVFCQNGQHIFGNFCKGVKIIYFTREILFGQLLQTFGDFLIGHTDYKLVLQHWRRSVSRPKIVTSWEWETILKVEIQSSSFFVAVSLSHKIILFRLEIAIFGQIWNVWDATPTSTFYWVKVFKTFSGN